MTVYVYTTSAAYSGTIQQLFDFDQLYVARDVSLGTGGGAFYSYANNNRALVQGTIAGAAGIQFGNGAEHFGHRIDVEAGAQIFGFQGGYGVRLLAYNTVLNNAGRIYGEAWAVEFLGINASTKSILRNSGVIESDNSAVTRYTAESTEKLEITNTGTIKGGTFAFQSYNSNAVELITNKGTMTGTVDLGRGNDLYDGRSGHHTVGYLLGGDGNDSIYGGAEADSIRGGLGQDRLIGSGGKDQFVFAYITETGTSSTTRDIILDFLHGTDKINISRIDPVPGGANEPFVFIAAKGTSSSTVATGRVGWYWEDNAGTANDRTIIRLNTDADAANEATIQLNGLINLTAGDFIL